MFFKKLMNTKKRKMYAKMCVEFRKVRKLGSFLHVFVQIYYPFRPCQRKWELYYPDRSPLWNCFKWLLFADLTSILKAYSMMHIVFLSWRCLLRVFCCIIRFPLYGWIFWKNYLLVWAWRMVMHPESTCLVFILWEENCVIDHFCLFILAAGKLKAKPVAHPLAIV